MKQVLRKVLKTDTHLIFALVLMTVILFIIEIFGISLPAFHRNIMNREYAMIQGETLTAYSVLEKYHSLEINGAMTREEAQAMARDVVSSLRYGLEMKDYFWIADTRSTMIMHPYHPELEDQYVADTSDPASESILRESIRLAAEEGEGFISYTSRQWKDDPTVMGTKTSFIKLFEPWGWIVGTGVYTNEVEAQIRKATLLETLVSILILCIVIPSMIYIVRNSAAKEEIAAAYAMLKQTQAQLIQSEKLAGIGQLAAGIAHEINTPIQFIGDNLSFIDESVSQIVKLLDEYDLMLGSAIGATITQEHLDAIRKAKKDADVGFLIEEIPEATKQSLEGVDRISSIVKAMKEFSHPGVEEKTAVDINHAIDSTIIVARNEWKYVADINTDFDSGLQSVPCYAGEFNQAILNMIVNSAHAIRDVVGDNGEKGVITISTKQRLDAVEISIHDTGAGIPREIQNKIFEPFFTTKEVGKGTGQGLAITHHVIVEKHHGGITLESEPGKGTTFIITLPAKTGDEGDSN